MKTGQRYLLTASGYLLYSEEDVSCHTRICWHWRKPTRRTSPTFVQRLIQTPSLTGHEGEVARVVKQEMQRLAYDEVTTDRVGNVVGLIRGGAAPSLMFNGHMDHVDPGDPAGWKHPPYSGVVVNGELWGRATVDMKGALAAMIYAGGLAKQHAMHLPGDLIVAAVVMEEGGGVGGSHRLLTYSRPGVCVVGKSSDGWLMRGHAGGLSSWRAFAVVRCTPAYPNWAPIPTTPWPVS